MINWANAFGRALPHGEFLARSGSPSDKAAWDGVLAQANLDDEQRSLLGSFTRRMNVMVLAGAWCGDCVRQCPLLRNIELACPVIEVRFLDRDAEPDVASELTICGGGRVPVVVFLSEDFTECGRYGDRTISAYRRMMGITTTRSADSPSIQRPPLKEVDEVLHDWLIEFERIQWMLRLSPRLRRRHGD